MYTDLQKWWKEKGRGCNVNRFLQITSKKKPHEIFLILLFVICTLRFELLPPPLQSLFCAALKVS